MNLKEFYRSYDAPISKNIIEALAEDQVRNDITSKFFFRKALRFNQSITAGLLCREPCILAGIDIFKRVFQTVDNRISFKQFYSDGGSVPAGSVVLKVSGSSYNLLRAERTALNFIQRMSGIATLTRRFVRKLKYRRTKILHTRKTTPNFRLFEIAAVKIGGGDFHRISLGSSVLIKDNHIKAVGSISAALRLLSERKHRSRLNGILEIEVKSMTELNEVLRHGKGLIGTVMLDNFTSSNTRDAVRLLKEIDVKIELSGGINEKNFNKRQVKGVNFYSIGMLTHSYKSIDFSLEL
jgi:nicotinate-nucleotide pyrophosphorylase (carboxylating)